MPTPVLLDHRGRPIRTARPERDLGSIRARYDAAQTTTENINHWANADGLSAAAANSLEVRKKLRERARYERDNNSYCSGMAQTLANDVIGTGPRLQVKTPDREVNKVVAGEFEDWTAAIGLAEKLRTYHEADTIDGEGFLFFVTNLDLDHPVKLDLWDVECDQVSTPDLAFGQRGVVDGIVFNEYGTPTEYHLLNSHPGDPTGYGAWGKYRKIPASDVLHWFKRRRPGQRRGVPRVTPALPLYALLRRYTLATVSAAEVAALFAVLLKTTMPPDEDAPAVTPFDTQELVRGMMAALPEGYEAQQMKPDHPATTYDMFESAILRQIARCLNMPFNVAAGNSSGYNYSSGRLDHQVYHRSIGIDRYHLETHVLDRIFAAWLREARMVLPDAVRGLPLGRTPRHQWVWDGFKHVDPLKEAAAQEVRLRNGTATLADEWAAEGYDWREKADEQVEIRAYYAEKGLPYPGDAPAPAPVMEEVDDEG